MKQEIWKPIVGLEGRYEVSNYGRVKSLAKTWNHRGQGYRVKEDSILKPGIGNGYLRVTLSYGLNDKKSFSVHSLVAKAFCDNPNNYPIVNHKNSNRSDNYFENLEWTTYKGNAIHAFQNGNRKGQKGEEHPHSRYRERDIIIIRKLAKDGFYSQVEIAKMFDDSQSNIGKIVTRQRWKHI